MKRNGNTVRYTAEELDEKIQRGETLTDWDRVRALTDEEIEASIDWEDEGTFDWDNAFAGLPPIGEPKKQVTVRLDKDVLDFFKSQGRGYQTRMNAVLRHWMNAHKS
jgi:uncharacterized protein (DUF4415 family)